MTVFIDSNNNITDITITDNNSKVNWENDFYDVGLLDNVNDYDYEHDVYNYADILISHDYDETTPVYKVDDVSYLIEQANDMINGIGDYDEPSDSELFVYELK